MIKTVNTVQEDRPSGIPATAGAADKGVVSAYIFLVIAFLVLSLVYTYTPMPDKYLSPAVSILGFVGIFVAGFVAAAKAGNRGWLHGAVTGILFALVRIAAGYAVFGHYVPSRGIFVPLLITTFLAIIGGIVGVNKKSTKKKS